MYLHEDVEDHFHESSLTSYKPKGRENNIDIIIIYVREVMYLKIQYTSTLLLVVYNLV